MCDPSGVGRIVFLGGIPGAGKTTLAQKLAINGLCVHVRASQLIRDARALEVERPEVQSPSESDDNQELLVRAFEEVRAKARTPIVLDGHYVIPTTTGPVRVADNIFARLAIDVAALIEEDTRKKSRTAASQKVRGA